MPPRFAYWTILIDNTPTAFRARDAQELLPTLAQLKRTNENVVMKWFSGGTLWDSPEAAREARRRPKVMEKRGADWRPGGQHRDPRARFTEKKKRPAGEKRPFKPGARKPFGAKHGGDRPRFAKPWRDKRGPMGKRGPVAQAFRPADKPADKKPPFQPAPPKRRWRGGRRDDEE